MTGPEKLVLPRIFIAAASTTLMTQIVHLAQLHGIDIIRGDKMIEPAAHGRIDLLTLIHEETPNRNTIDAITALLAHQGQESIDRMTHLTLKRLDIDGPLAQLLSLPKDTGALEARRQEWRNNRARHDYRPSKRMPRP